MRNPSDLSREELEQLVAEVRDVLYLCNMDGVAVIDPDKSWTVDTCQEVADVLMQFDLLPEELTSS